MDKNLRNNLAPTEAQSSSSPPKQEQNKANHIANWSNRMSVLKEVMEFPLVMRFSENRDDSIMVGYGLGPQMV